MLSMLTRTTGNNRKRKVKVVAPCWSAIQPCNHTIYYSLANADKTNLKRQEHFNWNLTNCNFVHVYVYKRVYTRGHAVHNTSNSDASYLKCQEKSNRNHSNEQLERMMVFTQVIVLFIWCQYLIQLYIIKGKFFLKLQLGASEHRWSHWQQSCQC